MKNVLRVFIIAAFAVLACGFSVAPTPEQREARERATREWPQIVQSRYDFDALTSFLKKTVAEKQSWKDVDLTKPKIGDKWTVVNGGVVIIMYSGSWKFCTFDPKENKFTLSFDYSDKENRVLNLTLHCIRKSKDSFELIEITSEDDDIVVLSV